MNIPNFEKKNHHYVPQYWQRGFRNDGNKLFGRIGDKIKLVSTKVIMQQDFLYTVYDSKWVPSDAMEDTLSVIEADDAKLNRLLHAADCPSMIEIREQLCMLLAVQASRHPDVLQRGHKLNKEFGRILANVHSFSLIEFQKRIAEYGIGTSDGFDMYILLKRRTKEQLTEELEDLLNLSPQSQQLPSQDAILAAPQICEVFLMMDLCLLVANQPMAYVLGDTPIPQSDLGQGFSVPLSQSLAVVASPKTDQQPCINRCIATQKMVDEINKTQWDNAAKVVIGPSAQLLENLSEISP